MPPKKDDKNKASPDADGARESGLGAEDEDQSREALPEEAEAGRPDEALLAEELPPDEPVGDASEEEIASYEEEIVDTDEKGDAADPASQEDEAIPLEADTRLDEPAFHEPAEAVATEAPKQSEPVTESVVPPPPPPPRRSGGGFWTGLLGALVGAAVGAGAVWYLLREMPRAPDPEVTAALDGQSGQIAEQADRIAAFEGEIAALKEAVGANDLGEAFDAMRTESEGRLGAVDESLTGLGGRLDGLEARVGEIGEGLDEVGSRLDAGDTRLADLEARPIADPETANQVLRSEVAEMRQEVEQATADARAQVDTMRNELATAAEATQAKIEAAEQRATELEAEAQERAAAAEAAAEANASAAEAKAALAQVAAALDSGEPYAETLAVLTDKAAAEVPTALSSAAESGVPTLGELREAYPDAARAALSASRVATTEGDPGSRLAAFLRTQTQARSLAPKEGDTSDAVLSRAEAALVEGDLTTALSELEALPDDGRAAMQDWIDSAEARAQAVAAADALSQGMN